MGSMQDFKFKCIHPFRSKPVRMESPALLKLDLLKLDLLKQTSIAKAVTWAGRWGPPVVWAGAQAWMLLLQQEPYPERKIPELRPDV
jgi:hypothetical protein